MTEDVYQCLDGYLAIDADIGTGKGLPASHGTVGETSAYQSIFDVESATDATYYVRTEDHVGALPSHPSVDGDGLDIRSAKTKRSNEIVDTFVTSAMASLSESHCRERKQR